MYHYFLIIIITAKARLSPSLIIDNHENFIGLIKVKLFFLIKRAFYLLPLIAQYVLLVCLISI